MWEVPDNEAKIRKPSQPVEEFNHLWTTKSELIGLLSLRPNANAWETLRAFFLYDQDRPIPFWEILERCGPWCTLAASAAPLYAAAQRQAPSDMFVRTKIIESFQILTAQSACLVVPIPHTAEDTKIPGWSVRWVPLATIMGNEVEKIISEMWEHVEEDNPVFGLAESWYDELSSAIPLDCVVGMSRRLPSGSNDIVESIVEAICFTNSDTVTNLMIALRGLAWQYALRESGMAEMSRAHDLTDTSSPSCDILSAIDSEYENLLAGLMFWGGEFLSQLPVKKG